MPATTGNGDPSPVPARRIFSWLAANVPGAFKAAEALLDPQRVAEHALDRDRNTPR